jgi:hypothetical protein
VAFIAHGYKGYGLEQADLIQEGTIGLMKAVKKFNPYKNERDSISNTSLGRTPSSSAISCACFSFND